MDAWRALRDYRSGLSLENETALAGCALACDFSSSEEFEAAVISKRRAAGMYRSAPWPSIAGCALVLALGVAFALF
jgi:hypothetical protein